MFLLPLVFCCFVWFDSFCQPEFLSWTFWLNLLFEFYLCISWVLIVCLFVCDRVPRVRRLLLRISRFHGSSARQVTLWSYLLLPSFHCIRSTLKHCMVRIWIKLWGWEVVEVVPIHLFHYQTLGVTSTLLILLCYACRRGLGLSVFMTDVRLLI